MSGNPGNFGLPSSNLPVANSRDGNGNEVPAFIADLWWRFLVRLSQLTPERPLAQVSVGPSPFSFAATTIGHLMVVGGANNSIVLTRGDTSIFCPAIGGYVPVAAEDIVTIDYVTPPSIVFIPSARA